MSVIQHGVFQLSLDVNIEHRRVSFVLDYLNLGAFDILTLYPFTDVLDSLLSISIGFPVR